MPTETHEWKDVSSRSQGQKDRTPTAWELRTEEIRVTVHRHVYNPAAWFVSCYDLGIEARELSPKDADGAKAAALNAVKVRLREMLESLD